MGVAELASAVKSAVDKRIAAEARAMRGTMQNGRFISGAKSYPMIQAVDVDTGDGKRAWAQLSKNGNAVVIGG